MVLCTDNKSFQVKEIESSSTFLLVDGLEMEKSGGSDLLEFSKCSVFAIHNCFLEAAKFIPSAAKQLRHFFEKNSVNIYDNDLEANKNWHSIETLLDGFQMSEEELRLEITKHPILLDKDKVCFLNDESRWKLLDELIECYENLSVYRDGVPMTFDYLRERMTSSLPDAAIYWVLQEFCAKAESAILSNYHLVKDKVCRSRAEQLLKSDRKKEWRLGDFRKELETHIPCDFIFELSHLRGLALLSDSMVYGKLIRPLLTGDLPVDVEPRLKELFSLREVWKADEISPYMTDCCADGTKLDEFLIKHCRIIRRSGEKLYSYKNLKM